MTARGSATARQWQQQKRTAVRDDESTIDEKGLDLDNAERRLRNGSSRRWQQERERERRTWNADIKWQTSMATRGCGLGRRVWEHGWTYLLKAIDELEYSKPVAQVEVGVGTNGRGMGMNGKSVGQYAGATCSPSFSAAVPSPAAGMPATREDRTKHKENRNPCPSFSTVGPVGSPASIANGSTAEA
ncbi:hypothetical protein PIB30_027445 [Stylosanthes scabra]|uniref:Uncharacterized protein n=1 Tax=Stylosanthes scabra TaxID=79078 RepID=A0ABU6YB75_9FABA|nr:hypothetical protein [Stylosanthes scabra]